MRRLVLVGVLMLAGFIAGAFVVSDKHLMGAVMGAILGASAGVIVLSFPRNQDYPSDDWFRD